MKIISKSLKDTAKIAEDFIDNILLKNLKGPRVSSQKLSQTILNSLAKALVVTLSGELGAGKTAFSQALGKKLGIKRKLNSPTFVIMKRYSISRISHKFFLADKKKTVSAGEKLHEKFFENLIHIDAYRLKNEKELEKLGWAEMISNPKNLILIEWPENVAKAIPKKHHKIKIFHKDSSSRIFEIKKS